jgi:amino acid transporter
MVGVLVVVAILIIVPNHHQSFSFVFTETLNNSGFSGTGWGSIVFWYVFGTGLLMAQYTITGFDASAHMSEETHSASLGAAWGMIMSVVVSVVFGFILLVAVTFAVPDVKGTLGAVSNAVPYIWENSMSRRWAEFLLFIACVAQLFCTIASVTSASRMMFAFSRDHAVPGWQLWRRITKRERVPVYAVGAICVLSWALMIPTWWNAYVGYLVGTSIAVIGLYIAFGLPILLRLRHGEKFEHGAFSLGRHYKWIGWAAVIWIAFICILFLMPTAAAGVPWRDEWDWNFANYAPLTVGGALVLFGGWWVVSANKWFTGPRRQGDEAELERIEAEYQRPGGAAPEIA